MAELWSTATAVQHTPTQGVQFFVCIRSLWLPTNEIFAGTTALTSCLGVATAHATAPLGGLVGRCAFAPVAFFAGWGLQWSTLVLLRTVEERAAKMSADICDDRRAAPLVVISMLSGLGSISLWSCIMLFELRCATTTSIWA